VREQHQQLGLRVARRMVRRQQADRAGPEGPESRGRVGDPHASGDRQPPRKPALRQAPGADSRLLRRAAAKTRPDGCIGATCGNGLDQPRDLFDGVLTVSIDADDEVEAQALRIAEVARGGGQSIRVSGLQGERVEGRTGPGIADLDASATTRTRMPGWAARSDAMTDARLSASLRAGMSASAFT